MSTPRHASHVLEAEAAVIRVLEAERNARAQVVACEVEAAQRVSDAGSRAQALRIRTEERIERLGARMHAQAEARLLQIEAERQQLAGDKGVDAATLARLHKAIDKLVAELAGDVANAGKD